MEPPFRFLERFPPKLRWALVLLLVATLESVIQGGVSWLAQGGQGALGSAMTHIRDALSLIPPYFLFALALGAAIPHLAERVIGYLRRERQPGFVTIDVSRQWQEVHDANRQLVGMKYVATITFNTKTDRSKVRLTFFEEVMLVNGGPTLQNLGEVSHDYRKPHYARDHIRVVLYERTFSEPKMPLCGERTEIRAREGRPHKVLIECLSSDRGSRRVCYLSNSV